MSFLAILEVLNLDISKFEQLFKSQIYQIPISEYLRIVKKAIFEIQIFPKLISRKIKWQLHFYTVNFNFTFSEKQYLEQSVLL